MPITPKDYAAKYHELEVLVYTDKQAKEAKDGAVPPGSTWTKVNLKQYLLWDSGKEAREQHEKNLSEFKGKYLSYINDPGETITVWVKTTDGNVVSKTYSSRAEIAENVNDPFYGKGNPEEVQIVLQLAVRYGLIKADDLQSYCDSKLGLDCTGFVGNYTRHVWQGKPWESDFHQDKKKSKPTEIDANAFIATIMGFASVTQAVTTVEDIKSKPLSTYVFAITDGSGTVKDHFKVGDKLTVGHIVITQPSTYSTTPSFKYQGKEYKDVPTLTVLEATGQKGLVESNYLLLSVSKTGIFSVYRGSKNEVKTMKVVRLL